MPSDEGPEADPIRALVAERDRLRRRHLEGLSGLELVRSLAAAVDAAVAALWGETVGEGSRASLVALGGYGRGELSPHSDLDLMVLHADPPRAAETARTLFYRLWDGGFEVGHAVRSVSECIKLARANFDVETSFLEARRLAGDASLFEEFSAAALRLSRKRGLAFVDAARTAVQARHSKEGNASCFLEPNLKDGAGGLRDLHTIRWLELVFGEEAAGMAPTEGPAVRELLHRTRNHLHYLEDRRQDVLMLHLQEPAASALGWRDVEGWSAWDAFMRDVYGVTRSVEHRLNEILAGLEGRRTGKRSRSRAAMAGSDAPIAGLRDAFTETGDRWTEAMRRAFFDFLAAGDPEAFKASDQVGVLSRYLPEWEAIRYRPQHNVYHRFTVDMHAYQTVAWLVRLPTRVDEPIAAQVVADAADRELLLLAGLFHDLGKGSAGDHSEAGERLCRTIATRIGLDRTRSDTLAWLVRNHLLLVDTATRRDTGDENLVVEAAAQVSDPERLRMLYALSVADGLATGATGWTPWKSALVTELFNRVLHVLERGELATPDASELVRLRITQLRAGLARHPPGEVDAHIRGMSRAYFLAFPAQALIRHYALMSERLPTGEIKTHITATEEKGLYELTLVSADRPGLFGTVAGALSLNGISVVSAQVHTRSDGAALEVFRVTGAFEPLIDEERWRRLFDDVRAALRDQLPLDVLLKEKRDVYARRPVKTRARAPQVVIDNGASDFYTVIEVHTTDHVGLLHSITRTLAELGLDIHLAKIATYGEDVVDAFYVWDLDGQKVNDPAQIAAVERSILDALEAN